MKDGRRKGNEFENGTCRALSYWLVSQIPKPYSSWVHVPVEALPFRRRFVTSTPLEGHWNGQGDILHKPNVIFPFCVECKKHEGWTLDGMFSEGWEPFKWWKQCKEQADKVGKEPLLVFTRNRFPVYVLLRGEILKCLKLKPKRHPVLRLERHGLSPLILASLEDLVAVPLQGVRALASSVSKR